MNIIKRELKLYKRSGSYIFALITPFVFLMIFGVTITGTIHNVPVGLVSDNNLLSNQISNVIHLNGNYLVYNIKSSQIQDKLISGEFRAVIQVISVKNNTVNMKLLIDGTDQALKDQIKFSLSTDLYQGLTKLGYNVQITTNDLYVYKNIFFSQGPSIIILGSIFGGLFVAGDTILNDKEDKTLDNVITSGFSPIKFTIEKITAFLISVSISSLLAFILILMVGGNLVSLSQILLTVLIIILISFIFVSLGIGISTFVPNKEVSGAVMGTLLFPLIFVSNAFLSIYTMKKFMITIAKYNPVSIANEALRSILLKNGSLINISNNLLILLLTGILVFLFAFYRMNKIIKLAQS